MNLVERQMQHRIESRGFHSGQQDLTLSFSKDGKTVGYIDYSVWNGDVHIQMIKVLPEYRRQGLGTEMLRTLQREYPETEINVGSMTDSGSKFIASMKTRELPNGDVAAKQAELAEVRAQIAELRARHDDLMTKIDDPDFDRLRQEFIDYAGDRFNDLYDREYELSQEVEGKSPTKRIFEEELPLLTEKYSRENNYLLQYLKDTDFDPYHNWWQVCHYIADSQWRDEAEEIANAQIGRVMYATKLEDGWDGNDLAEFEPDLWEKFPDEMKADVAEYVTGAVMQDDPADAPSTMHFQLQKNKLLPRSTWLVHFTDDPWGIRGSGFTHGTDDMQRLGLTTWSNKESKKRGGYNFAFIANSRDAMNCASRGGYGKHAVLFQSSGVHTYHNGDNEDQIIFWGPDVNKNDIVVLVQEHGEWQVLGYGSGGARPLVTKEYYEDAAKWVMQNFAQYRNYF